MVKTLGIVGPEAARFTPATEQLARVKIRGLLGQQRPLTVCSGACHRGGIDIWAVEEARTMGAHVLEYPALAHTWTGYRARNIKIARASDKVVCVTLASEGYCRYCGVSGHVQSGGCWTLRYARETLRKPTELVVIGAQ